MAGVEGGGRLGRPTASPSTPVGVAFVAATLLLIGGLAGAWTTAVYALSFWHYAIYALAFVLRAVPLAVFERDAVLMKAVSLAAFAAVYLTVAPDFLSLLVVALGLAFNLSAAWTLGTDRTYYGYELGVLEPRLVSGFPYSVLSHPMLTGNAVAFAGTLLNDAFRADWWPLAVAHVVLNLAILVMEARARPRRPGRPAVRPSSTGSAGSGRGQPEPPSSFLARSWPAQPAVAPSSRPGWRWRRWPTASFCSRPMPGQRHRPPSVRGDRG